MRNFINIVESFKNQPVPKILYHGDSTPVYYHGTKENFDEFSFENTGGIGMHFTKNYNEAKHYAGKNGRVISVHLNLENPANKEQWKAALNKSHGGNPRKMAVDMLKKEGFDSVETSYETIAFYPRCIQRR